MKKRRVWIKRKDKVKQRYWKNYGATFEELRRAAKLRDKGLIDTVDLHSIMAGNIEYDDIIQKIPKEKMPKFPKEPNALPFSFPPQDWAVSSKTGMFKESATFIISTMRAWPHTCVQV